MIVEVVEGITTLTPDEGFMLTRDGNNFTSQVFLGKNDSTNNYTQVSIDEVNRIELLKKLEYDKEIKRDSL